MGTIKLKKTEKITKMEEAAPTLNLAQDKTQEWADPAVLREVSERATAYSRHYILNNGTEKSVIRATAENYFDEEEQTWKSLNYSLTEGEDTLSSHCGKTVIEISKPARGKIIRLKRSGMEIGWEYLGKKNRTAAAACSADDSAADTQLKIAGPAAGTPSSRESRVVYENADAGTDLEYILSGNNVKENIVIKEKADQYSYFFAMHTEGGKLQLSDDKEKLVFYSEQAQEGGGIRKQIEAEIPAPFMYDAQGNYSEDVSYELTSEGSGNYVFAVIADAEWINREGRAFPVTIDPRIVVNDEKMIVPEVQYRNFTGENSENASPWYSTSYPYLKVSKSASQEYRTALTIRKSQMGLREDASIISAKLCLQAYQVLSSGHCLVNNYWYYMASPERIKVDITGKFEEATGDFTVLMEAFSESSVNAEFYADGANAPYVEVEYIAGGKSKIVKKNFSLAGGLLGQYDVITGDMTASFCDVPASDSRLNVGISHVYKKSAEDFHFGKNFRLNLNETLEKAEISSLLKADYFYTDAQGDKYGFKDTYYYLDEAGAKQSVAKEYVHVGLDGHLTYTANEKTYEVRQEQRTLTGLTAITQIEGVRYAKYLEQRTDEYKQLENQKQSYENTLKSMVLAQTSDGNIKYRLKDYLTKDNFWKFSSLAGTSSSMYLVCSETEALTYRSLILQKKSLANQFASVRDQVESTNTQIEYNEYLSEKDSEASAHYTEIIDDLEKQRENLEEQKDLIGETEGVGQRKIVEDQIQMFKTNSALYKTQIEQIFKEYLNVQYQLNLMDRAMPVNYLTDGKIVKGFNAAGRLVAIFDRYENVLTIEYDEDGKLTAVYEGEQKKIAFAYNPQGLLQTITDARGRRTSYAYINGVLDEITYADGRRVKLSFSGDDLTGVSADRGEGTETEEVTAFGWTRTWNNNTLTVTTKSHVQEIGIDGISHISDDSEARTLETLTFTEGSTQTMVEDQDGNREKYVVRDGEKLAEYYREEAGKVVRAELYDYEEYDRDQVRSANRSSLYCKSLEEFLGTDFEGGDEDNVELDEFNNPLVRTTNARPLSAGSTRQMKVDYEYDDNHKCVKESALVTIVKSSGESDVYTQVTAYRYNASGDVVRKESYIEGEELITGKTIEETEYDERGNAVRSFTYNSLDSSSKFYTESEVAENGQTLADYDETGEHKTEYEYISGTEVVRAQKLPNGSKFAYGHDADDRVTSISQSTEEGEENSTQTRYTCGEVTELVSGNNTVRYTYDGKRRVSGIELNGAEYVTIATTDATEQQEETAHVDYIARNEDDKSDRYEITRNKRGDVLSVRYAYESKDVESPAYAELYTNAYDSKHRITQITQGSTVLAENEYDDLDRQTKHTFGTNVHTIEYDDYSQTSKETIKFGEENEDKQEYVYTYDEEKASRPVTGMTVGAFGESCEQDVSGRSVKVAQTLGGNTYTKRYGYYKHGDHATSRVNTVYYGKNGMTDGKVTYTYDSMGNIISVSENGKQRYVYGYDKLCRLISEKDLYKNKEVCYTYDNNGNILTKRIDGEVTEYKYQEGSDRLVQYGAEQFGYDNMGNPTTYRNMTCTWEKGRQLKSVTDGANTATYSYDVFGVRSGKVVGGEETSYVYENGKLLRQVTDGEVLDFYYGSEGVIGFKVSGSTEVANGNYLYRKNLFGDITGIIDESGALVYEYGYSAFGKSDKSEETGIGAKNPFRYRGYYYDEETGLYYLKSRYYDPEVGRFITIDDISYLDPETINGLNLYAYCGNNPVMYTDPTGTAKWWQWLLFGVVALAAVAFVIVGTALSGGTLAMLGGVLAGAGSGFLVGAGGSIIAQGISSNWQNIDPIDALISGGIGASIGAITGAVGTYFGELGAQMGMQFGYNLGNATIAGLRVGKAFEYLGGIKMIMSVGKFFGSTAGVFVGGALSNELANNLFGVDPTVSDNLQESFYGLVQGWLLTSIYNFFRWIR